jgi:hypothetical protein
MSMSCAPVGHGSDEEEGSVDVLDDAARLLDDVSALDESSAREEDGARDVPAALVAWEVPCDEETSWELELEASEAALELMLAEDPIDDDDGREVLLDPPPSDEDAAVALLLLSGSTPLEDPLAARWQMPSRHSQPCAQSCASRQP